MTITRTLRTRAIALGAALLSTLALGCAPDAATSVVLLVTADPEVRSACGSVRLGIHAGDGQDARDLVETRDAIESAWPMRAVIVPEGGDATRTLRITAEALDASGTVIARVVATPAFVSGRSEIVALHFEASCLGVTCAAGETCTEGRCTTPPMPVTGDAGTPMRADGGSDVCDMRTTWLDRDGDGFGDPATMSIDCDGRAGGMTRGGDCDDACPGCFPGSTEICEGAHDEDCDGDVDEDCECTIGEIRPCAGGREEGPCHAGTQACISGRWSECVGRVDPVDETCNSIDDDCDGMPDDELRRGCGRGCHSTCHLGTWGACRERDGDECDED